MALLMQLFDVAFDVDVEPSRACACKFTVTTSQLASSLSPGDELVVIDNFRVFLIDERAVQDQEIREAQGEIDPFISHGFSIIRLPRPRRRR